VVKVDAFHTMYIPFSNFWLNNNNKNIKLKYSRGVYELVLQDLRGFLKFCRNWGFDALKARK